jgi:hypothetical protein
MIPITLDTVDQSGQHINGSVIGSGMGAHVASPATLTYANGGTPSFNAIAGGLGSPDVQLPVLKDTTYWINAHTGVVESTESTSGTNKVNFAFEVTENHPLDLYMRGNAPSLILDSTAPSGANAIYKDSPSINRTSYKEIGTWNAIPMEEARKLNNLGNLNIWIGLKNSDDQGTYFDIRAEILKNGVTIASGEVLDIRGVTRNPDKATKVEVAFGAISDTDFQSGDIFSIRILTKVAASGGHSNAVGLRLYYDSVSRPSGLNTVFAY